MWRLLFLIVGKFVLVFGLLLRVTRSLHFLYCLQDIEDLLRRTAFFFVRQNCFWKLLFWSHLAFPSNRIFLPSVASVATRLPLLTWQKWWYRSGSGSLDPGCERVNAAIQTNFAPCGPLASLDFLLLSWEECKVWQRLYHALRMSGNQV